MVHEPTDWLREEIGNGMQRLVLLSLPNTPAFDLLEHTAQVWYEALLSMKVQWNKEDDAWRIQKAFMSLCCEVDRFPSPKHLIERLPVRREKRALPKPEISEEDRQHGLSVLNEMMKKLGGKLLWHKK